MLKSILIPLLLGLARDRGRRRVLDLHPTVGASRAVRRAEALRHDALAAERASLAVNDRSIRDEVRVERDARMFAAAATSECDANPRQAKCSLSKTQVTLPSTPGAIAESW